MVDPLSQMVELLQPSALRTKMASGAGCWRVERAENGQPFYCLLLEGAAQLSLEGGSKTALKTGDFVLIPAPFSFAISSTEDQPDDANNPLAVTRLEGETRHGDPDGAANARFLVGHFGFASSDAPLLVALLPQLIHIRDETRLTALVQLVSDEASRQRPARDAILARLLEVLLIEALRSLISEAAPMGILRGLGDPRIARAIRLLHDQPAKDWTVDDMAERAALSRSVFFNRFRQTLGVSPKEYLTAWRMSLAKNLLRTRADLGLQEVAQRVGYQSASAFSTAFSRCTGLPPSLYTTHMQTDEKTAPAMAA